MTGIADRRFFHSSWLFLAGVLALAALPIDSSRMSVVVDAQVGAATGNPDPCDQLVGVPGNANGLHKRCQEVGGGSGIARADFNGDGIGDLVIGVPYEDVGSETNAGAVHILYGSAANGLTTAGNQLFTQDSSGVATIAKAGDHFGRTVSPIDFNNDSISDLAVGAPGENDGEGIVHILFGSTSGLSPATSFTFMSLTGVANHCAFGSALAWGNFDDDSLPDLAIGARDYSAPSVKGGAVLIRYGNGSVQFLHFAPLAADSGFGTVLAAGDHNGDGFDDLAIGAPEYDGYNCSASGCTAQDASGIVLIYGGHANGVQLAAVLDQAGAAGNVESGDHFGRALAFGDFDLDGKDDLVVGAPYEDRLGDENVGAVSIFYGAPAPPWRDNRTIVQNDISGGGGPEPNDLFGAALASADFDGDGYEDLAIGVPGEDWGSPSLPVTYFPNGGLVHVLYSGGSLAFSSTFRSEVWHQDASGVPGAVETGDQFGASLSAWNFGRTSQRDLAIGVPFEDVNNITDAGAVVVLYGNYADGLESTNSQLWHQDVGGVAGAAGVGDRFGTAMY